MKLYITGGPGSGKTRAAQEIARHLAIPTHCLDNLVWDNSGGMKNRRFPETERDDSVFRISSEPSWIIEGTYYQDWVRPIFERADCVIILATPPPVRLFRLVRGHFIDRSPFRDARSNLKLFLSNVRWGMGYESGPLPQLIGSLDAMGTPFLLHRRGDLVPLAAGLARRPDANPR